tara:strand:- start:7209 stop:8507 length:1299 start_codon:yes stop_codon:yes gene_type:complete
MKQSWKRSFGILLIATLLSKLIGFFREIIIASKFGVADEFDILLTVFVIPNMIISLLLYAIPHIVIPRLDLREKSDSNFYTLFAKQFFWPYILFLLAVLIVYNVLFELYINYFPAIEFIDHLQLVSNLTLIFSFFVFFSCLFNILKAVYNAKERFVLPSFTPLLIHFCVIFFVLFYYDDYGVYSFAYGLLIGSILQIGVFVFDLMHKRNLIYLKPSLQPNRLDISSYAIILLIEFLGQSYTLIDRSFIQQLPNGHVSSMYYAGILNNLPVTILGLTFGTVFFPKITLYVQERRFEILWKFLQKALLLSVAVAIPFSLMFVVFGKEIIILMFERGAFTRDASYITSKYLSALSLGLPFIFIHILLAKISFAFHVEKMLLFSTVFAVLIKVFLSYYFISNSYYWGLSLSTSISFLLNVLVLGFLLFKSKTQLTQ